MNVSHSHASLSVVSTDENTGLGNVSASYLCASSSLSPALFAHRQKWSQKGEGDWQRWEIVETHFAVCLFLLVCLCTASSALTDFLTDMLRLTVRMGHVHCWPIEQSHSVAKRPKESCVTNAGSEKVLQSRAENHDLETCISMPNKGMFLRKALL